MRGDAGTLGSARRVALGLARCLGLALGLALQRCAFGFGARGQLRQRRALVAGGQHRVDDAPAG
ncbi:MAG: hypothetical protein U1F25_11690 [Rubrivivax sp.]